MSANDGMVRWKLFPHRRPLCSPSRYRQRVTRDPRQGETVGGTGIFSPHLPSVRSIEDLTFEHWPLKERVDTAYLFIHSRYAVYDFFRVGIFRLLDVDINTRSIQDPLAADLFR